MSGFDDILKKGKKAVTPSADPSVSWKSAVGTVLYELQRLNNMYNDQFKHHVFDIERIKCRNCATVTFLLAVHDINDISQTLRFHSSDWKSSGYGSYICAKCQKP